MDETGSVVLCDIVVVVRGETGIVVLSETVTFGANVFSSRVFADLPRTVDEAQRKGWTMIDRCRSE